MHYGWARPLAVIGMLAALSACNRGEETPPVDPAIAEAEATLNGQGRLLVRPSGTEKLIRVMAEGDDAALVKQVVGEVAAAVKAAG